MINKLIFKLFDIKHFYDKKLPQYFMNYRGNLFFQVFTIVIIASVTSCSLTTEHRKKTLEEILSYESTRYTCNGEVCITKYETVSPACRTNEKPILATYKLDLQDNFTGKITTVSYDVPVVYNDRVEHYIKFFTGRGKDFFSVWLERTGRYMPFIKKTFREEGIPEDLAYIALIESGLNHNTVSKAKAVGIWQFMKKTATLYGMRVDWWVDERKDFEKSTRAAAKFLKKMHERFGTWEMALAAYNAGEGRVSGAARKNDSNDFWVIMRNKKTLKIETRDYVPKFMAAMLIAKNPKLFGFHDLEYLKPLEYDVVVIKHPTDLKVIAKAAGASLNDIKNLNPNLIRWYTPDSKQGYSINIPKGTKEVFATNMEKVPPGERLKFLTHKVAPGESLWSISRKYDIKIKQIVSLNNLNGKKYLREGITLMIPVPASA